MGNNNFRQYQGRVAKAGNVVLSGVSNEWARAYYADVKHLLDVASNANRMEAAALENHEHYKRERQRRIELEFENAQLRARLPGGDNNGRRTT